MDEPSHQPATQTTRAYVGLGSNLGDRAGFLLLGVRGMLHAGLPVARLSSIYETGAVDVTDQPAFLNMVAELAGTLPAPEQLLARLLRIEYALGRRRDAERPRGPRTIDLDLLVYGEERRQTDFLTLPHPRLHLRRFALTPLVELAPDLPHPALGTTFSRLLAELQDDNAPVRLWQTGAGMSVE
jgi:2-amino-4-hydroxy-6-hydroxymethyldihydropteridine diphosphokinase